MPHSLYGRPRGERDHEESVDRRLFVTDEDTRRGGGASHRAVDAARRADPGQDLRGRGAMECAADVWPRFSSD